MLIGQRILVTRPRTQAFSLAEQIQKKGATAVLFPVLETHALAKPQVLEDLSRYQRYIFISQNAVKYTWNCLSPIQQDYLQQQVCIAVGQRTAAVLAEKKIQSIYCAAAPYNSEALLASARLQSVDKQAILLCKGQGGRKLLQDSLIQRGAELSIASVYQRCQPKFDLKAHQWIKTGAIDQVIITSAESLYNLERMIQKPAWLYQRPWVVLSQRLAHLAQAAGVQAPIKVARQADNLALIEALARAY